MYYLFSVSLPYLSLSCCSRPPLPLLFFFFFNDPATTEIYTLSLHDALPISRPDQRSSGRLMGVRRRGSRATPPGDRKSTRLNSSHQIISYAVFCLKKKKHSLCYL